MKLQDLVKEETPGKPLVTIAQFDELATGVISYFNHPNFPNAAISNLVEVTGTDASTGAGASVISIYIQFKAERDPEWYSKVGLLAKIVAENVNGNYPRMVNLSIKYVKPRLGNVPPHLHIELSVGVLQVRVGEGICSPKDLKVIQ
jgi:hypothetical protein